MLFSFHPHKKIVRILSFSFFVNAILSGLFLFAGCTSGQDPVVKAASSVYRIVVAVPLNNNAIPNRARETLRRDGKIIYADKDSGKILFLFVHDNIPYCQVASGSSYLISRKGHLVTNDHVVHDPRYPANTKPFVITAISPRPQLHPLTLLWADTVKDLAIVQTDNPSSLKSQPLVFSEFRYDAPKQSISAIGFPGASDDLTLGGGFLDETGYLFPKIHNGSITATYKNHSNVDVWEHSAALSPGDSGGPLVNDCGQVVGTNHAGHVDWQNIRHAIVSNELIPELKRLNISFSKVSSSCLSSSEKAIQWMQWTIAVFVFVLIAFGFYFQKQIRSGKFTGTRSKILQTILNIPPNIALEKWTWDDTRKKWYRYHPTHGFEYWTGENHPSKDDPDALPARFFPVILKSRTNFPDIFIGSTESVTVGSTRGNVDIQLANSYISAKHLRLFYDGKSVHVEDLNSTNGTFVNGNKISKITILHPGDVLQLTPQDNVAVYVMQYFGSANKTS